MNMINLENLNQLTDGDQQLLNSFLGEFLTTTQTDLNALQKAVSENNADNIAHLAHRIKGSAMIVGAESLIELSKKLEDAGAQNNQSRFPALLSKLETNYSDIADFIKTL